MTEHEHGGREYDPRRPHGESEPCPEADESVGDLARVQALAILHSLEGGNLAAILEKLATIEASNTLIVRVARSLESIRSDFKMTAEAVARIETSVTNLKTFTEQHMATNQEILARLDTRTTELGATITEMANDLISVRDRIQSLIDSQGDAAALRSGLETIMIDKLDPAVAQAAAVGADLDVMGRNPSDPFPAPTDPNGPNAPMFATAPRRPTETEAQYRERTAKGDPSVRQPHETESQWKLRTAR